MGTLTPRPLPLLFLLTVAGLVAATTNSLVEHALSPPLRSDLAPLPPSVPASASLPLERLASLLGLPSRELTPDAAPPPEPARSPLRVRLLGTLVSDARPEWSIASVQDLVTLKTTTLMTGDTLAGSAQLLAIERHRLLILRDGRREFIDLSPSTTLPELPARGLGLTRLGPDHFELSRAELERALANLPALAGDARIVPVFKDGVAQGFKLFSLRPDGVFARLGLENGDVVRRINGLELTNTGALLELTRALSGTARLDLELERSGATLRRTFSLR